MPAVIKSAPVEKEIMTPQAEYREKMAKESEYREKNTKVIKEWVEVIKKYADKPGKVILKQITNNGYEHSTYIGKETHPEARKYLQDMAAQGKYKPV